MTSGLLRIMRILRGHSVVVADARHKLYIASPTDERSAML